MPRAVQLGTAAQTALFAQKRHGRRKYGALSAWRLRHAYSLSHAFIIQIFWQIHAAYGGARHTRLLASFAKCCRGVMMHYAE